MKKRSKNQRFFHYNFFSKNRKAIISEYLPWILIAVAVLAIVMITIFLLKEKGFSLIDQIKNLFKGR